MTERTAKASDGSTWIIEATPNPYGKRARPERAFWVQWTGAVKPTHLAGVVGFYAASRKEALAKIG